MKMKFRFSGRGGQGIKFVGSTLAKVALVAGYHTVLAIDYTPSVRGGPIFCDVVISSEPVLYPYCDRDAGILLVLDQKGFARAAESICEKTISFVDAHTVKNPEERIARGSLHRVPLTQCADDNQIPSAVNTLSLGFLSKYLHDQTIGAEFPVLNAGHYRKVFEGMPARFRDTNTRAFQLGEQLCEDVFIKLT